MLCLEIADDQFYKMNPQNMLWSQVRYYNVGYLYLNYDHLQYFMPYMPVRKNTAYILKIEGIRSGSLPEKSTLQFLLYWTAFATL